MPEQPLLSVLLTTHEQPEHLESLLDALLGFGLANVEIIIINDAAEPSHARAIRLLLDLCPNERVFCFEHDLPCGRSRSLNEAIHYANGQLLWAPLRADRLNRTLLKDSIRKMVQDPAAFWILDRSIPQNFHNWLTEIEEASLPDDSRFIFNRSYIPPDQLYINERIGQFQAAEMAYRLMNRKSWQKTDSFFVIEKSPNPLPIPEVTQEFLFTMLRETTLPEERSILIKKLGSIDFRQPPEGEDLTGLEKIRRMAGEDARLALGMADNYLKEHPRHEEASKLKVKILEKLRRHVEAAELKHELQKKMKVRPAKSKKIMQPTLFGSVREEENNGNETDPPARLSIIIPTTGDGKPTLEKCLIHLDGQCDAATTELIIIDNASIDDTFSYLEQLKNNGFLNIRVITNPRNRGFGAAANQGLEAASGTYALVMHNDLLPEEGAVEKMISLLDANRFIGAIGPVIDKCDNPLQLPEAAAASEEGFVKTDHIDSCCMLVRLSTGVRFNEAYGFAFYEDADFCKKLAELGYYVAVATHALAVHGHRLTSDAMGLHLEPELRWENADIYNAKWKEGPDLNIPSPGDLPGMLELIPLPVNPLNPPGYWLDQIDSFLSDETRTVIQNRDLEEKDLFNLIRILMIADKRDFLRQIETRVKDAALPDDLLKGLIRYYYRHNIYSRCRMYLEKPGAEGPYFDLYRLRIAIVENETENAVGLLTGLMNLYPCHPDLFKLAGDIHRMGGNEGEAKSFYALADQLGPERQTGEEAFEIKY